MDVTYSADLSAIDETLKLAKQERPTKPIKLRIQPGVFRLKASATDGSGTYQGWKSVAWTVECPEPDDAIAIREGLRVFFEAVETFGAEGARQYLQQALDQVVAVPEMRETAAP